LSHRRSVFPNLSREITQRRYYSGAIFQLKRQGEEAGWEGETFTKQVAKSENYENEVGGYRIIASGRTSRPALSIRRCRNRSTVNWTHWASGQPWMADHALVHLSQVSIIKCFFINYMCKIDGATTRHVLTKRGVVCQRGSFDAHASIVFKNWRKKRNDAFFAIIEQFG